MTYDFMQFLNFRLVLGSLKRNDGLGVREKGRNLRMLFSIQAEGFVARFVDFFSLVLGSGFLRSPAYKVKARNFSRADRGHGLVPPVSELL